MPNDVVLDPTVHHLFAKDRFNRGKFSRSWPLYPRCGHNLSLPPLPRCPPFVEVGTPDLLWLYKSQRKAWKKGGEIGKRKTRKPEAKKSKTEELNRKSLEEQRRKTQHTEEEKQGGDKLNKKHNQRRKTWTQTEERGRTEGDRTGNKTGKTDEKGRTQTSENWEAENTKKTVDRGGETMKN